MATLLQRNNKPFPFTNRLPLTDGKVSESDLYWRGELERLYDYVDQQARLDFDIIAVKILDLEERIEVLEP